MLLDAGVIAEEVNAQRNARPLSLEHLRDRVGYHAVSGINEGHSNNKGRTVQRLAVDTKPDAPLVVEWRPGLGRRE